MLQQAAQWLADVLTREEGVPATYARTTGAETITLSITVVPGRVRPERFALADGRANLDVEPADFMVRAEDLDFGAGPVEPQTGDRITVAGRTYEALPRDGELEKRPPGQFDYTTAGGAAVRCPMWRVRCIRVKVSP